MKFLKQIFNSPDLRKKILFTIAMLIGYRFLAHITIPGANKEALAALSGNGNSNSVLTVFSLLTGGGTENLSIVLMGISPYINASIIIQLLTIVVPKLENLSKEGEQGRNKINQYVKWLTFPLAFLQSYGMLLLINSQVQMEIITDIYNPAVILPAMLTISAGTVLLVWLGEQITEYGIGNGISLIIFTSILARVPTMLYQSLAGTSQDISKLVPFLIMMIITVILLVIVIIVSEAERKVPITYAGRGAGTKGEQAFLPIKINQAGMIPIIFAVAMISFPAVMGQFLVEAKSVILQSIGNSLTVLFQPNTSIYLFSYFILVVGFTYFYVAITFNPKQVAENIQKRGGYVPGIRPGSQTETYLKNISKRLTFFGSTFLAFIAVSPLLLKYIFSNGTVGSIPLLISGAGMIIIVGVVLELIRQINAQLVMHDYSKFY